MQPLWLLDSIGSRLIKDEQRAFSNLSVSSFGNYFLQLGIWGKSNSFAHHIAIKNRFLINTHSFGEIDLVADLDHLPLQNQTIDVVFLPHTLEQFDNHLGILGSIVNTINESGTLIVLGFNPASLWGLRYWASGKSFLPGIKRLISPHQYNLWLINLGFRVELIHYFHAIIPLRKRHDLPLMYKILNPFLCGCYMIVAKKEIVPLTLENQFIQGKTETVPLVDSFSRTRI